MRTIAAPTPHGVDVTSTHSKPRTWGSVSGIPVARPSALLDDPDSASTPPAARRVFAPAETTTRKVTETAQAWCGVKVAANRPRHTHRDDAVADSMSFAPTTDRVGGDRHHFREPASWGITLPIVEHLSHLHRRRRASCGNRHCGGHDRSRLAGATATTSETKSLGPARDASSSGDGSTRERAPFAQVPPHPSDGHRPRIAH